MPSSKKKNSSATRSWGQHRPGRKRHNPETEQESPHLPVSSDSAASRTQPRIGRNRHNLETEHEMPPPPVSREIVASNSPASHAQASTAPMMIAPSIVVPGLTGTIGSSQQESAGMTQDTNISGA